MFRSADGFRATWRHESANTAKVLERLTDQSLGTRAAPGHRSIGDLAWHIVVSPATILGKVGLVVEAPTKSQPAPPTAVAMQAAYVGMADALADAIDSTWTREMFKELVPFYGVTLPRGETLEVVLRHEIHHRGQLTMLMRLAGLPVPGVYGPSGDD